MEKYFYYDSRLKIELPILHMEWKMYSSQTKENLLAKWETIRGLIPDRIRELEMEIEFKQNELYNEENFERSCHLNEEISELASIINDLWIWYRSIYAL